MDTVSQSRYAILLGMPLPVWGVLGYVFLLGLSCAAFIKQKGLWLSVLLLSLGYSIHSVILALISNYIIKSYCLFCIGSYVANFLVFFLSLIVIRRFYPSGIMAKLKTDLDFLASHKKGAAAFFAFFLMFLFLALAYYPDYWSFPKEAEPVHVARGVTEEGEPWIGSENPELVITEYSDYLCFQCRKMHFYLRNLIRQYPDKIRLIHRNFPMDHRINPLVRESFHDGAGVMAVLSKYGLGKGKFWEINDYFYRHGREKDHLDFEEISLKTGLSLEGLKSAAENPGLYKEVLKEIREGIAQNVRVTPTYVISGKVYSAGIPPEVLSGIFEK